MRAVVLLGVLAALVAAQGMPPALVEVAKVEKKTVAAGRTFVGTIRPFQESVVGAEVAGRVAEMLVREGDRVKTGQVIARLRSRLIEVRIEAAKGGMKLAEAQLAELKNALTNKT